MQLFRPAIRVENPHQFGAERAILLNRAQIVLNLLRADWDNSGMRFYLAAANRCLIVTEPTLPHTTFTPGVHLVETPIEQMAQTLHHYLARPEERQPIVERAYRLVTSEYTMRQSVGQILERALAARAQTVSLSP
jgi:spore maturation protein CgeB